MTALEKLEAALTEHAADYAKHLDQVGRNRRVNRARWQCKLHGLWIDSDGWSYATKARWQRQAQENRK